ncbi:threonine--tRNA ligase [Candidatus Gracilibacteria bacterium]|nr:threonine--tRNA ligase [Candidatus Gracilibacteria bacterium]
MSSPLSTRRHSLSHIMAQATRMVMGANSLLAIGPDIDTGWYYDIDFGDATLEEAKLKDIEKKMKAIIRENQEFRQFSLSVADARSFLTALGEIYKVEMVDELEKKGETMIGFYANIGKFQNPVYKDFAYLGEFSTSTFIDMCQGPHVPFTSEIPEDSFKLDKIAGAYWRGDAKNKQLTRIYGLAFENKEELDAYTNMMEEAKKRDHRILGKKLKLFTISDLIGAGLPLMQPNGMIIRKAIEDYLWELHANKGYSRVWTPHIAKECLYETSGHAAKFGDELFRVSGKEEKFIMKPMNCPHHMQIFADNQFSYRDMPVRYFEPATVYRDEKTGQLSGLTRVRSITQDDGHLFCRVTQIKDEVKTIVGIIKEFYTTMGMMEGYWVSLSVRDPLTPEKYLGTDEVWKIAEGSLEEAAQENKLNYKRMEGEAAFYGPKLDFMFRDAIGRQWQLATIQCDFNLPNRFELKFTNEKGEEERPVVIHRAISGSLERFMGIMIEHFAGTFPLWLAPEQVRIIPVGEAFFPYAEEVFTELKKAGLRVSFDDSTDSLGKKIRNAETEHANYILVVGEQEMNARTLAVRNFKTKEQSSEGIDEFITRIQKEIQTKAL